MYAVLQYGYDHSKEKDVAFICKYLNPLHPEMLCVMFGWNWPSGSGEEDENKKSLCMVHTCNNHECDQ